MHKQQILEKSINRITIKRKYAVKETFYAFLVRVHVQCNGYQNIANL